MKLRTAQNAIVIFLIVGTTCLLAQTTVPLVINTKYVDLALFNINGPGLTGLYTSGAGGTGERLSINPSIPLEGYSTIQLFIHENIQSNSLEILFDYNNTGNISNVRVVTGAQTFPLNPRLFSIINNEIIFYTQPLKPTGTIDLKTNLIDGILFDRSSMNFFAISGAENFTNHELRIYEIGDTGNQDYSVFNEYTIPTITGSGNRLIYSSTVEFRWNGCEVDPENPGSFNHTNAGAYLFELDLWDTDNKKKTYYGQMLVQGLHSN